MRKFSAGPDQEAISEDLKLLRAAGRYKGYRVCCTPATGRVAIEASFQSAQSVQDGFAVKRTDTSCRSVIGHEK